MSPRLHVLGGLLAMVIVVSAVVDRSSAAFTDATVNPANAVTAGTAGPVSDNSAGGTLFDTTAMRPGDTKETCVRISYGGTLDAEIRLYASTVGSLPAYLDLSIDRGANSGGFNACSGFTTETAVSSGGTLAAFAASHSSYGNGADAWTVTNGTSEWYRIRITLQDTAASQNVTGSATFTWEAQNTDGALGVGM